MWNATLVWPMRGEGEEVMEEGLDDCRGALQTSRSTNIGTNAAGKWGDRSREVVQRPDHAVRLHDSNKVNK